MLLKLLLVESLHIQLINMYCLGYMGLKRTFFFFLMKSTSSGGGGGGRVIFGALDDCGGRGILGSGGLEEEGCGLSSACFTEGRVDPEDNREVGLLVATATLEFDSSARDEPSDIFRFFFFSLASSTLASRLTLEGVDMSAARSFGGSKPSGMVVDLDAPGEALDLEVADAFFLTEGGGSKNAVLNVVESYWNNCDMISKALEHGKQPTLTKKPLSLASWTIIFHRSSLRSKVGPFPKINNELLARVSATFIRLVSFRKPIWLRFGPDRTQDKMMMSFSWPWKPSTVLNLEQMLVVGIECLSNRLTQRVPKLRNQRPQ